MNKPTVAIVGASPHQPKFGNKSVRAHLQAGHTVFPIHPTTTEIEGLPVLRNVLEVPVAQLDRISVYVPPAVGLHLLEEIARQPAREIWFNSGAESDEIVARARELGLDLILGCNSVALGLYPEELD